MATHGASKDPAKWSVTGEIFKAPWRSCFYIREDAWALWRQNYTTSLRVSEQELPLTTIMKPTGQTQRLHMLTLAVASQVAQLAPWQKSHHLLGRCQHHGGHERRRLNRRASTAFFSSYSIGHMGGQSWEEEGDQCFIPWQLPLGSWRKARALDFLT